MAAFDTVSTLLMSSGGAGITLIEADGTAMEGAVISADGNSAPWGMPFAIKGVGLVFELGTVTSGTVQPKLQMTFNGEADTPTWFDLPQDASTVAVVQVNQVMGTTDEQIFEWFSCHVPSSGSFDRIGDDTNGPDVQMRVDLVGASTPVMVMNQAKVFLVRSLTR